MLFKFKSLLPLFIFFLLTSQSAFALDTTNFTCYNATTQLESTYDNSSVLTKAIYLPCEFGCDSTVGVCQDASPYITYGYLTTIGLIIAIFFCLFMIGNLQESSPHLRNLFFFLSLVLVAGLFFNVGIVGSNIGGSVLGDQADVALNIGNVFAWILVVFLVILVLSMFRGYFDFKKNKDEGDFTDDV